MAAQQDKGLCDTLWQLATIRKAKMRELPCDGVLTIGVAFLTFERVSESCCSSCDGAR
jgi:hypothetical protein